MSRPLKVESRPVPLDVERRGQGELDERVRGAIDLMESAANPHLLTEAGLARSACLSVSRLAHLFRQQTGVTPLQMLKSIKLQRAAGLLLTPQTSVKEIAGSLGFRTVSHFTRLFKDRYLVTPCEFRRHNRQELTKAPVTEL